MADKTSQLSIVIRTVDQATAKIKAINEQLDKATKPARDFKKALGEFSEKSGLSSVVEGFKGVGDAVKETLFKVLEIGLVVGEATHLVLELVNQFDELGKKAERIGVSVDFLAGMRDAAERSGVAVEALDTGLQAFAQNLGQAKAGTGRMKKFLDLVNPAFERQLLAAKGSAEALDLLADGMARVTDPAKRLALAQKTLGSGDLATLFARGGKGLEELREHYHKLAGSQEGAVKASEETHDAMLDLKASTDGAKAALVEGLAPALTIIIGRMTEWLQGHREDIREWAKEIGEKLPGAVAKVVDWVGQAIEKVRKFLDFIGGIKTVAIALAAIALAPLIASVVSLTGSLAGVAAGAGIIGASFALWAIPVALAAAGIVGLMGELEALKKMSSMKNNVAIQDAAANFEKRGYKTPTVDLMKANDPLNAETVWNRTHGVRPDPTLADRLVAGRGVALLGLPSPKDISDQARSAVGDTVSQLNRIAAELMEKTGLAATKATVNINFANAPPGMRATVAPNSTADVDVNTGYQLGF